MEIGGRRLVDLLPALGDLSGTSLADVSGRPLAGDETPMIRKCVTAWRTTIDRLTCEQVRLLLSQGLGVPWTSAFAFELLQAHPCACATFYQGDLANAVLRSFDLILAADPEGARQFLKGDFGWVELLVDQDVVDGGTTGADARAALDAARRLAG